MNVRKTIAAASVAGLLAAGAGVATSAPAVAQQQSGLVNVAVGDVTILENVGVGVAANVAAALCGIQAQVGVLAQQVARQGGTECTAETGDSIVRIFS